ncbi:SGNH/GDSL hydrolase family protein [Flavobacterium aquicola]|uniref:Lysophospholipase L1-like esterase n=1 Tax=Flavobacterium aquicola TaxID=1682742 RepID=A0A3E0EAJ2_9FLAO|nr:SGNH/GDSL hydrolase family protein [Flavobacterium aquicola]REG94763.1 lysophospholipase L1-like esterase [Flavobacterium aquicola]
MKNKALTFYLVITLFVMNCSNAQDWANLKRYEKENAVLAAPMASEKRIVFMGNSITEGWLRTHPSFFAGKPYIDRGISGQTTPQMLLRFRQDVVNCKASVVVILAGLNDIAQNTGPMTLEETAGNIFSMAELAKANGIDVIICSVLPASDFPWRPGMEPGRKVVALNALLKKYAKEHTIPFVDYYTPMVNDSLGLKKELGDDGVHPNEAGYKIMEPIVEKAIADLLKKSKK